MHYASFLGKLSIVNNLTLLIVIHSFPLSPLLSSGDGKCGEYGGYKNIPSFGSEGDAYDKGGQRKQIKYTCRRIKAGCCCCCCLLLPTPEWQRGAARQLGKHIRNIPYTSPVVPCRAVCPADHFFHIYHVMTRPGNRSLGTCFVCFGGKKHWRGREGKVACISITQSDSANHQIEDSEPPDKETDSNRS